MPIGSTIGELIARLKWRVDTTELDTMQRRVSGMRTNLDNFAKRAGVVGAALTGTAFAIGRTVHDFEASMNLLSATYLDATEDQLAALRAQALELGATTQRSASEAAMAQVEFARSGKTVEETQAAVADVLKLSIAGMLDMGEATQIVSASLSGWQLEASEAGRVTDVLAATASKSMTTVKQMGRSFRQVAPLAGAAGISIEKTAAAIGVLRNQGLLPEQAGTGLRNVMAIMVETPTPELRRIMGNMGLDPDELSRMVQEGKLFEVLRMIGQGEGGWDLQKAMDLFGREAGAAGMTLVRDIDLIEQMTKELENAHGTTERMADEMAAGLPGAIMLLKSAFEALQIGIGDAGLKSVITTVVQALTSAIGVVHSLGSGWKLLIVAVIAAGPVLLGLAAVVKGLSLVLGVYSWMLRWRVVSALTSVIGSTLQAIRFSVWYRTAVLREAAAHRLSTGAARARAAAETFLNRARKTGIVLSVRNAAAAGFSAVRSWAAAAGTAAWAKAQWALNLAMSVNPMLIFIAAVVGVIAVLVVFRKQVWSAMKAVGRAVKSGFNAVLDALKTVFNWVKEYWPLLLYPLIGPWALVIGAVWKFRDEIIGALKSAWDWVKSSASSVWQFLSSIFDKIAQAWDDSVGKLIEAAGWVADKLGLGGVFNVVSGRNDPPAAAAGSSVVHQRAQTSVNVEQITVNAEGGDPERISQGIRQSMEEEFQYGVHAFDSGTAR